MWEKFFFYLNRFNAIVFALLLVVGLFTIAGAMVADWRYRESSVESDFGLEMERVNSIIGQEVETRGAKVVAYYESDEASERKELAGLVLVNLETSETLRIASSGSEHLVDFEFLYDQGDEARPVVGYIARVASESQYREGRSNLVIGALPAMTRTEIARDVTFVDLPTVRSDGHLGLIMWQDQDVGEVIAFRLSDGQVVDRASVNVPRTDPERLSQGPGRADDPALTRRRDFPGALAPARDF